MNIKPTSEQCQVWSSQAESFAINIRSQGRHGGKGFAELFNTKFAELAAQWGASQAQQTTEPEAWSIPEWSKQDDLGGRVPSDVRVALNEAHRAGVRVGMAQSQWQPIDSAPQDGTKVLAYTNDGYKYPLVCQCVWGDGAWWPDVWESPAEPLNPTLWMPLFIPPAMQGGQK